jgi:type II secretory pathway pseudopilin PulG
MKHLFHVKAFTLVEVLLSVGLMAMIVAIPFTLNSSIIYRVQAESAQSQVGNAFRKAQTYAQQGRYDSNWGVYIQSSSITVFSGATYATRNTTYDDVITFDSSKISMSVTSGVNQVVFTKITGIPSAASTVVITAAAAGSKSIAFSTDGRLTYN